MVPQLKLEQNTLHGTRNSVKLRFLDVFLPSRLVKRNARASRDGFRGKNLDRNIRYLNTVQFARNARAFTRGEISIA
jgi:hypothetical protein